MNYTYDKFDLFTLAMKQKLIGCSIHIIEDSIEKIKVVLDYFADFKTGEIHIQFLGDEKTTSFDLNDKYKVTIVDYTPVKRGAKGVINRTW